MRDFKEFLTGTFAVTFDSVEELEKFLKYCDSKGLIWWNGEPASSFHPVIELEAIRFDPSNGFIWRSPKHYYFRIDVPLFPSKVLVLDEVTIEVFRSKNTVVCLKRINGKVVARGTARCCPSDVFDFNYGASLAFERMCGKKSVKTPKKTIVKQDSYRVGDIVLIKKKWKSKISVPDMDFMLGNAYEVVSARGKWSEKEDGHSYKLKVCEGEIKSFKDYWYVYHSDIKGKVV